MIKFGTGGWRTIIGEDFIKSNIIKVAHGLSVKMAKENCKEQGVVIGFDRRFLSVEAAKWMAEVLAHYGVKVYFIDKIAPTPMIMYTVKQLGCHYGIAITASHNPAEYNGIKVFTSGGKDASEEVTSELEDIISEIFSESTDAKTFENGVKEEVIEIINPFNDYIDAIMEKIDTDAIRNKQLRILLDPMYGVSKTSLQTILLSSRCEVDLIHDRHDTLFGGRLPSPSAETLNTLKQKVVEKGYDLGLGTDGDADRLGVIDNEGNFIHPNEILVLIYYYLLNYKHQKGPVVRNIATTHLLDAIAEDYGEECYEVPVGFKHISSKMEEKDAILGGESSGGLTIAGHIKGKDGVFAASVLVEMVAVTGLSIAEMLNSIYNKYGEYHMVEYGYSFNAEDRQKLIEILYHDKTIPEFGYDIDKISTVDGIKVYFKNGGWVVIRFSGTEPLLRVFAEMDTIEEAEKVCKQVEQFIKEC
ncbi:phosphoglucomutase/phosphomannomutase family protein [Vallitalea okinawensis]|uniref:phosphoglucomutase/phosphomannomutase family protein n=1 Tax=Vallitalea okinawensis TaxID=2078660 RepID=UPI000CFDC066|nr:phosphoglucomutase/phosphomannomutase family protein [Vallitalea okinawensis]